MATDPEPSGAAAAAPPDGPGAVDLGGLGLDTGAHLLIERALGGLPPGARVEVRGRHPALAVHLRAWCRLQGHGFEADGPTPVVVKGTAGDARWASAQRAGDPGRPDARASPTWGLAARGALVETGGPPLAADLVERDVVWADIAPRLYAQAASAQWDPATAVDWDAPFALPDEIEAAVVQVMTYLVENEQAALVVPARLLTRVHPHFREVVQLLAVQAADEARHVEVFTRRALLRSGRMGRSSAGGRASLDTLLAEHDFSLASFLLSLLGEGTFLDLLAFLQRHAPDPVTARITHLALRDEARHVAFGVAHLEHAVAADPRLRGRLRHAVERRHDALRHAAGLNQEVLDALVVLAAGSWAPDAVAAGWAAVQRLQHDMDEGRRRRLVRLGFPDGEAAELSALHTRNFM